MCIQGRPGNLSRRLTRHDRVFNPAQRRFPALAVASTRTRVDDREILPPLTINHRESRGLGVELGGVEAKLAITGHFRQMVVSRPWAGICIFLN